MKKYNTIIQEMKKNRSNIEELTAQYMELDQDSDKSAAIRSNNMQAYKAAADKAKENQEAMKEISDKIYKAEIIQRILQENAQAALFAEAYPVIKAAFKKYNGKQYGEKTKQAIYDEVRAAGYSFYFTGYSESDTIEVYPLDREGYKTHAKEAKAIAIDDQGHIAAFITRDNKINLENVTASPRKQYTENPTKKAAQIIKAAKAHQEATRKAKETASELASLLPEGLNHPEYISEYALRI